MSNLAHVKGDSFKFNQRRAQIKARVLDILQKCDPGKADKVDMVLDKFEGREKELFEKLRETYSDNPQYPTASTTTVGIVNDAEIDKILAQYEDEADFESVTDQKRRKSDTVAQLAALKLQEEEQKKAAKATEVEKIKKADAEAKAKAESAAKKKAEAETKAAVEADAKKAADAKANQLESKDATKWSEPTTTGPIKTCKWWECRRLAKLKEEENDEKKPDLKLVPEYGMHFCSVHAREIPRDDGLCARVVAWEFGKGGSQLVVQWVVQMVVVADQSKFGQRLPKNTLLQTTSKLRFSALADIHAAVVKHYRKEKWEEDLKQLPKFASKHQATAFGKLWSSNDEYGDEFLAKRKTEIQIWLDAFLMAPKMHTMKDVWALFGLVNMDNNELKLLPAVK